MIPWASFTGRDACYTDLQFPLYENILLSHAGPPLDLKQEFGDSSMLDNASERRFAYSQLSSPLHDIANEHMEAIENTLTHLTTFFEKNGLFMASPRIPSSSSYEDDLQGLTADVMDEIEIPEFHLDASAMSSTYSSPQTPEPPATSRTHSRRSVSSHPSNRLSISSLIHADSSPAQIVSAAQAMTPITVDSFPSPVALDKSHLNATTFNFDHYRDSSSSIDYNHLFDTSDSEIVNELSTLVRSRNAYNNPYFTTPANVPLALQSRTHKSARMRRSSRSRARRPHSRSEAIRKAMIAEEETRRIEMERIGQTWRVMKQKEEEEQERQSAEDDARLLLSMTDCYDDQHLDEKNHHGGRKRVKLEQGNHVTSKMLRLSEGRQEELFAAERYNKYDRGPS